MCSMTNEICKEPDVIVTGKSETPHLLVNWRPDFETKHTADSFTVGARVAKLEDVNSLKFCQFVQSHL